MQENVIQKFKILLNDIKKLTLPKNKVNQTVCIKYLDYKINVLFNFELKQLIKSLSFELPKNVIYQIEVHENGNFTSIKYSSNNNPQLALTESEINFHLDNLYKCFKEIVSNDYSLSSNAENFIY